MSSIAQSFRAIPANLWTRIKDFAGYGGEATYLWPRWFFLRAVGIVFIIIFAGIIKESAALIGPDGITPLPGAIAELRAAKSNLFEAIISSPTLFFLSSSTAMVALLQWGGLLAAIAVVLNLWPRMSLFICWLSLLSFAKGWLMYSGPMVDRLMLEVTLLCVLFAPAGFRPGLGAQVSARPIIVFMMRWLLFRIMFENGISKILGGDLYWFDLRAMDIMYETAPSPTILGFFDHHMPHDWHLFEIALTFAAEIIAPLIAVFCGRRGRWWAFWLWAALQAGIQLTCNFGWLNTASIALGLLLLDDKMFAQAAGWLRLRKLADYFKTTSAVTPVPPLAKWRRYALCGAMNLHFYLSIIAFTTLARMPMPAFIESVNRPLKAIFDGFGSINGYSLFSRFEPFQFVTEFLGSNDGGVTWRTYDYRYFPQKLDRISPFTAPRLPRFEANIKAQSALNDHATPLFHFVATRLLEQKQPVIDLFESNPFPDSPPTMIRVAGYKYSFTDLETYRETGHFWTRIYLGEYMQPMFLNPDGEVGKVTNDIDQLHVKAYYGNLEAQTYLGFLLLRGENGAPRDPAKAAQWFLFAAKQGHAVAQLNLAMIHLNGQGAPKDIPQSIHWGRSAAEQGLDAAQDWLGIMYMRGEGVPRDPVQALAWFEVAADGGTEQAIQHRDLARGELSSTDRSVARQRAELIRQRIASQTPREDS
ncbi:MAG: hypothetical protein CMI16_05330 [Opitutaceae bacterium]|nr:hypothetical protein [Opitutaceae bacterium]|tara:strand:+ start:3693 stop:5795 length:2103 start_codon:yes stop_codon:yes gene_type:complete